MGEYLIFESCDYRFALPSSLVASLSEHPGQNTISFAQKVFRKQQSEKCVLTLKTGLQIGVSGFIEIQEISGQILPVPGYIFDNCNDWLRGIFWSEESRVLLLNQEEFECILRSA